MKFKFRIALLLFIVSLVGCSFIPNELKNAEQLIETNPDSALHILRHLSPNRYKSESNKALYNLLMVQTLNKKKLPLPDSLLKISIDYYTNHPDGDRLATCYLYKGRIFKYSSQYEKAMQCYMRAVDEIKNTENIILLGRINYDLGDIYNIQGDHAAARQKYKTAYDCFSKANFQLLAFYSLYHIGRTYHAAKEYKIAEKYYKNILPRATDSIQLGDLYQEIGLNFYDSHKYDSALCYYQKAIKCPSIQFNPSIRYSSLAGLYYDLKQFDSAFYYASNAFRFDIDFRTQRECYRIMTNCKFLKGNTSDVTTYMNKYVALGDSLRKVEAQIKGSYIETMHSTKKEATKNKNMAWYMACLALLILTGTYFLTLFIIRKTKKEKNQIKKTHLQQNADRHKEVLVNHREVLQNKIKERKLLLAPERKKADPAGKIAIDRRLYEELLHINDIEYFYDEMNSVLNNLVNKLKKQFPSVTSREIMWCCLSLLQVPNTDMYMLLETNVDSLKKMKQRLVPKFNLAMVSELQNFLISLISE